jgi:hypothetical protein
MTGPRGATEPRGAVGPTGATGQAGTQGPAGPGFDFTTASGTTGPVIPATGTYFIKVEFDASNSTPNEVAEMCSIVLPIIDQQAPVGFTSAFVQLAGTFTVGESVSGMLSVTDQNLVGQAPSITCLDPTAHPISISGVQWYVSSVHASG